MKKAIHRLSIFLAFVLLSGAGCSDIIMDTPPPSGRTAAHNPLGMGQVHITTEPDGAKIMLISMGSRQMQTFYSPADINYMITPAMPTVVTIAKKGYKPKNVRLDGSKKQIHVILDKAPLMPTVDFGGMGGGGAPGGGPAAGRPSDIGVGGAMGPGQDMNPTGPGQGGQ